ncbi:MAG TPA: D-alanyl-D-alanine carboxypeptidase family protein, partial [Steroidobacteraceae bacterium]
IDVIDRAALPPGAEPQLLPQEYAADGIFARLDAWLARHAGDFGFFRPYDLDRGGVQPEPWHLSFAPVSGAALRALTVDVLREALDGVDLAGAEAVGPQLPEIHARYVQAVATPSKLALAAPRLATRRVSPATRPS